MAKKTRSSPEASSTRRHAIVLGADACPACGTTMRETQGNLALPVNGEEVTVPDAAHLRCPACGEEVLRFDEARRLHERAFELYQKKYGLLTADEIRAIRERLQLTQSQLAELLRLGANTISRWEAGRTIQTAAMDLLLRVIRDVPGVLKYLRDINQNPEELALPSVPREQFENPNQQAYLHIFSLLRESNEACEFMRLMGACALLSSPDYLVSFAPKGLKRLTKKWQKSIQETVPIETWLPTLDYMAESGVLHRVRANGGVVVRLCSENLTTSQQIKFEEWVVFDARLALQIIDSVDAKKKDPILHRFSEQDLQKIKVAS